MKTEIRIPKTDITITCRNKREQSLGRIFVRQIHQVVGWALESDDPSYWAREVVSEYGYTKNYVREMSGQATSMYWLGMLEHPIADCDIHGSIMALYNEKLMRV